MDITPCGGHKPVLAHAGQTFTVPPTCLILLALGDTLPDDPAVTSDYSSAGDIQTSDTGGTDHQSFDQVGLPGFQFIQDEVEYGRITHHSNMDVYDHAVPLVPRKQE